MEERYWLRHPTLHGHLGPYRIDDLRQAVESETFPRDSYVLVDSGQNETDRMASPYWRPVTALLGMEPPPPTSAPVPKPGASDAPPVPERLQIRFRLREGTAYSTARTLIVILAMVALLVELLVGMVWMANGPSNGAGKLTMLILVGLEMLATIAIAAFLQAMLDIADASLKKQD